MSNLSEQREQEASTPAKAGPRWIWVLGAVGLLLAAWAGYDFYSSRKVSTLDSFAQCLSSKGLKMYGAWWCPHCAEQKELFGYAFHYVNYVECSEPGLRTENDICKQAGIKNFPTWQYPDGSRTEGNQPLSVLSEKTGCALP